MKVIKIILGILVALTVVFFGTGLLIKETSYSTQISVDKPLPEVFELFNDASQLHHWIPELKSIEVLDEKPGKTGSTYRMVVSNQGEDISLKEKVLAYVPNEKVTLFFNADGMLKTDDYKFSTNDEGTLIVNSSKCRSNSFILSCIFPYFKGTFKAQDQSYLDNFKTYIENK